MRVAYVAVLAAGLAVGALLLLSEVLDLRVHRDAKASGKPANRTRTTRIGIRIENKNASRLSLKGSTLDPNKEHALITPLKSEVVLELEATTTESPEIADEGPLWKWRWWVMVVYLFWAQALVCDEYFVPSIEAACERFNIPEDVAGATLMALGCNGPELFTNVMSLFVTHSDVGVGAIVGSEIFNLLCIVGCTALATPPELLPLRLDPLSFSRDCFFYFLSIGALFGTLIDEQVQSWQAASLFGGTVLYAIAVSATPLLRRKVEGPSAQPDILAAQSPSRNAEFHPERGMLLQIRARQWSRMLARTRPWKQGLVTLEQSGQISISGHYIRNDHTSLTGLVETSSLQRSRSPGVLPQEQGTLPTGNASRTFQESGARDAGHMFKRSNSDATGTFTQSEGHGDDESKPAGRLEVGVGVLRSQRHMSAPLLVGVTDEHIDEVVIKMTDVYHLHQHLGDGTRFEISVRPEVLGLLPVIWEFKAGNALDCERWVSSLRAAVPAQNRAEATEKDLEPSHAPSNCGQVLHWFAFPVEFALRMTIPDSQVPRYRKYFPFAFTMSMVWLAFFSYCVCAVCDKIHELFGISDSILGLTVAAIGTSFPNLVASVAVAKMGKSAMAVSNALGSNVQNVFLALGVPWFLKIASQNFDPLPVKASGIREGVVMMLVTLAMVVMFVLIGCGTLAKPAGGILLSVYFVWATVSVLETAGVVRQIIPDR